MRKTYVGPLRISSGHSLLRRACEMKHKSGPSVEESQFWYPTPPTANISKGSSGIPNGFIGGPYDIMGS